MDVTEKVIRERAATDIVGSTPSICSYMQKLKDGIIRRKAFGELKHTHIGVMLVRTLKFNANMLRWSARGNT